MRRMMLTIAVLCAGTLTGAAQQPSTLRFEVASIKLWQPPTTSAPGIYRGVPAPPGSGIFNRSTTLAGLIAEAYDVQDFQLSGGDNWTRTERYDVAARAGRDVSKAELGAMVKTLLADRFKLRVRGDTRDLPILELRLARSDRQVGSNLHDCSKDSVPETPFRAPTGGTVSVSDCGGDGGSRLATMASRQLKTLVVDKTGLTGQWWYAVFYRGEPLQIPGVPLSQETVNPDLPSFEGALREQLGLRLERTQGPVPVIVIESADRPTPN
jgi:uncharacterized protein (TIGR03435 family)